MSMRTWVRGMAHAKAERAGVEDVNNKQIVNGKVAPSKFALHWREMAMMPMPKPSRKGKEA